MAKLTFLSVLKSNLKCAFCKNENCPVRYMPKGKKLSFTMVQNMLQDVKKTRRHISRLVWKGGFRDKLAGKTECII